MVKDTRVRIRMRDGVLLAANVFRPAASGRFPAILIRTPYRRGRNITPNQRAFVEHGYAVVVQDVRGMGASQGEKHVFYAEGWRPGFTDGADTVAWIKAQPWCNGKIGSFGGSALGMTQMLLAPATRDLTAQNIYVAPSDFYRESMYHGGVLCKNLIEGWLTAIKQPHIIDVYKSHPYYDEYWSYLDATAKAGDITSPVLLVGGWFDIFQQGTLNAFMAREERGGPGAKGNNYLIMKWSSHGPEIENDYKLNKNRRELDVSKVRKAFFDYHLRGNLDALKPYAKVNYYVMGADTPEGAPGNEWRKAETWPPFATTATPYYLRGDGTLATEAPAEESAALEFTFDPKDPYPTHGGQNLLVPAGAFDQRLYSAARADLLKFATAPLDAPIEVTGRVGVKLFVSTDAPDTDFTAKLVDIYPPDDDREILVLDNIQRVKLRKSLEKPEPLLTGPEEVVEIQIDLWSISWIFNTGHRIGLHISSSNFPRFEVNPNTGADFPTPDGEMRAAHNRVHLDAAHPSALILPVRPAE